MQNQATYDHPSRTAFVMASLPVADCVLNQVNTAFGLSEGGVSPLQVVRGALLLIFLGLCARVLITDPSCLRRVPLAIPAGMLMLSAVVSKEICENGRIALAGLVPYGQMLYWLLLWAVVVLLCSKPADARLILKGVAIGSVVTAVSVFLGLMFGTGNFYSTDAVHASAGWFETAKMITGVLTTGGVVLLFLGEKSSSWYFPLLAWLTFAACIATYARAGTAALIVALGWLAVWVSVWGRNVSRSARRFAIVGVLLCTVGAISVSPAELFSRWNEVEDGASAGSGRATFWKIAIDAYAQDHIVDQVAGRGYSSMSTMLYDRYGDDIKHTHNDALDLLLVGGIAGCVWLLIFLADLISMAWRCPTASPARAAAVAILLIYTAHGLLTGQIWGTDSMSYYTMSLSSIVVLRGGLRSREQSGLEGYPLHPGKMIYTDMLA